MWQKSDLLTPIPKEIQQALEPVNDLIGVIQPLLATISAALQAASAFISGTIDPFVAAAQAVIGEIEALINDLFATGGYSLTINPLKMKHLGLKTVTQLKSTQKATSTDEGTVLVEDFLPSLTPTECIDYALSSFDDAGDENRPIFTDAAQVAGYGFMATSPSLGQFLALIQNLMGCFAIPDWQFMSRQLERYKSPGIPSTYPDWNSWKLNSFGPFKDIQDALLDLFFILRGYLTIADNNIAELVSIIDRKVKVLQTTLDTLDKLIKGITKSTGIWFWNVPLGIGGVKRLKQELRNSVLEDPCLKNGYTVMSIYVAGGPSAVGVDNIRKLFI